MLTSEEARIKDLGPGDLVQRACGHSELITAAMLATAGVRPLRYEWPCGEPLTEI